MIPISPKRHRKRLRISVDTTNSILPEYPTIIQDSPPDYSSASSAEHADEESDTLHHHQPPQPPRKQKKHLRKPSSSDLYLDTLLARSVQALELSNTLLESSMNTNNTLSTILSPDSPAEKNLEARAHVLSSRIHDNRGIHESWKSHLEEITRDVENLFTDTSRRISPTTPSSGHSRDTSLSSSLPPTSTMPTPLRQHRRMTSVEFRKAATEAPQLRLAPQERARLISPPPRAMTQYIATSTDPDSIVIPSTIGLRAASHSYRASTPPSASSTLVSRDQPGKAYEKLAAISSHRSPAGSRSNTPRHSPLPSRNPSISRTIRPPQRTLNIHPDDLPHRPTDRSRSGTRTILGPHRQMTPPEEEAVSSSDDCRAKLTVQSLRKILDVQPAPAPPIPKTPAFPISPSRIPETSSSNATASVSRLFTKPTHTSTTRPRSPTRSSLKSARSSPVPSPTRLTIPDTFGASVRALGGTSNPSSGRSTPKRISFAELPESYASTRPEGMHRRVPSKRRKHRKSRSSSDGSDVEGLGWLARWLLGPVSTRPNGDDWKSWSGARPMGGSLDDWSV